MEELTKYLGSLAGIGALFLIFFKIIFNLGKKDQEITIKNRNNKIKNDFIKAYRKAKKKISNLSDDELDKLLRK